jgi:hypothetical protein
VRVRVSERSPKVGINQLSSIEFRGLASDCVCNHGTPPWRLDKSQFIFDLSYSIFYILLWTLRVLMTSERQ